MAEKLTWEGIYRTWRGHHWAVPLFPVPFLVVPSPSLDRWGDLDWPGDWWPRQIADKYFDAIARGEAPYWTAKKGERATAGMLWEARDDAERSAAILILAALHDIFDRAAGLQSWSMAPFDARRKLEDNGFVTVYDLAVYSGLRRNELKTLRRAELDLDRRVVTVLARRAKSRKQREVTLPASCCERLKAALGKGEPTDLVFPLGIPSMAAFYRHLKKAGITEDTPDGHVDFHALRTTFGTNLARSGATPAEAQRMLGHSDPRLTMRFYTKLRLHDQHAASARLETFMARARRVAEEARAAGGTSSATEGDCSPRAERGGVRGTTARRPRFSPGRPGPMPANPRRTRLHSPVHSPVRPAFRPIPSTYAHGLGATESP